MVSTFKSKKKKTAEDEEEATEGVDDDEDEEDQDDEEGSEDDEEGDEDDEADGDGDDDDDDEEVDEDREACDEEEMEKVRGEVEAELQLDRSALKPARLALQRLSIIARRVHYSSSHRRALKQYCVQKKVPVKILPRAVVTRWTSLTNTIAAALVIRPAVTLLTATSKHKLSHLALDDEQWTFLSMFHPILEVDIILFVG